MSIYQISDLEQLSGIKAHTIRIWEKRYNLFTPDRSVTNIRYYNDEDAIKLLNTVTLLNAGYKISKIADLSTTEINSIIKGLVENQSNYLVHINVLIEATLTYNKELFEKTFNELQLKLDFYNLVIEIIYPFLVKIGVMWSTSETTPIQEHFASTIIRKKLIFLIEKNTFIKQRNEKVILFLPENEWHEIGLFFSEYILNQKGIYNYNFGQNVPTDNLIETIKDLKPTHLLLFFISRKSHEQIYDILNPVMNINSNLKILISGSYENLLHISENEQITIINSPDNLIKYFD